MSPPQTRSLRILFVIDDMDTGGAQKQVAEVINHLDPQAFTADLVCLDRGGAALGRLTAAARVHVLGARRVFDVRGAAAALRLARIIRSGGYDIVEAYLPAAHFLCALATATAARTALVAARRNLAGLDPAWFARCKSFLNRATSLSIANSAAVKQSVVSRYGVRPCRVVVVPNIIRHPSCQIPRDEARRALGLSGEACVVAAAGSLTPVKDYPTILTAFARLCARVRDAHLVIAGDGRERGGLEALAGRLALKRRVHFVGSVPDVADVLAAADIFVHASRSEGCSNAVLEAMSHALPIVASDIAANREALRDCARYFQPGDRQGCAEALAQFAADPTAAAAAGRKARLRLETKYATGSSVTRRERLYRRIQEATNVIGSQKRN